MISAVFTLIVLQLKVCRLIYGMKSRFWPGSLLQCAIEVCNPIAKCCVRNSSLAGPRLLVFHPPGLRPIVRDGALRRPCPGNSGAEGISDRHKRSKELRRCTRADIAARCPYHDKHIHALLGLGLLTALFGFKDPARAISSALKCSVRRVAPRGCDLTHR